jgi:hypothetical protein
LLLLPLRPRAGTRSFYQQLRRYPQEVIPLMDSKVHELYVRQYGEPDGGRRIQVKECAHDV